MEPHGLLIGRAHELDVLLQAVTQASTGRTQVVTLSGHAGTGKSRLLAEVVALAREVDVRTARAVAAEAFVPYAAVQAWPCGSAPDPLPELIDHLRRHPTLLVLDDAQWADTASIALVRRLVARRLVSPVAVIIASRPGATVQAARDLMDELRDAGAVLDLDDLSEPDALELLATLIAARPGPRLVAASDAAHGNPFLLHLLVAGAAEQGRLTGVDGTVELSDGDPLDLSGVLRWRLRGVPAGPRAVLRALAILGQHTPVSVIAEVSGRPRLAVADAMSWARDTGLLVADGADLAFRHDLIRDAVYQDIPAPARRLLHRQAADALRSGGADPAVIAAQLHLSAEPGDSAVAQELLAAALHTTHARSAIVAAAITVVGPQPDLLSQLAAACLREGAVSDAVAALGALLADDRAQPEQRLDACRSLLAVQLTWAQLDAAAQTARIALAQPAELDAPLRTLLGLVGSGPRLVEDLPTLDAALLGLEPGPLVGGPMRMLAGHVLTTYGYWATGAAQLAEAANQLTGIARHEASVLRAVYLFAAGDPAADLALAAIRDQGPTSTLQQVTELFIAVARNDWSNVDGLHHCLLDARAGNPIVDAFHAYVASLIARARSSAAQGQTVTALLTAAGPRDPGDWLSRMNVYAANANALCARGQGRAATTILTEAITEIERTGSVGMSAKFAGHVGTLLDHGDIDTAHRLGAVLDEAVRRDQGAPTVMYAAWKDALLADDPDLHLRAVDATARSTVRIDTAELYERAAKCLGLSGRREEAVGLLCASADAHRSASAWASLTRVRARLRRLGVSLPAPRGRHGTDALTAAEQAVAELAQTGLTNAAIAQRLLISTGTVGTHLSRIYRKLGIGSRVELARLGSRPATGPPS